MIAKGKTINTQEIKLKLPLIKFIEGNIDIIEKWLTYTTKAH